MSLVPFTRVDGVSVLVASNDVAALTAHGSTTTAITLNSIQDPIVVNGTLAAVAAALSGSGPSTSGLGQLIYAGLFDGTTGLPTGGTTPYEHPDYFGTMSFNRLGPPSPLGTYVITTTAPAFNGVALASVNGPAGTQFDILAGQIGAQQWSVTAGFAGAPFDPANLWVALWRFQ